MGLHWWLSAKESPANAGGAGLISGSGRPPGGGNGNPVQYSCLESPMDRGAWWATVHGVTESDTTYRLANNIQNMWLLFLLIYFIYFLAMPSGMQDLSSLTRDRIQTS